MKHRVLVIEDDPDVREVVLLALEMAGYEARGAQHGREALGLLFEPNGYALLLLDMRMPVMDGWAFSEVLRSHPALSAYHDVPIIVITASADAQGWANGIAASGYLAKPFGIAEVQREVDRLLER